MMAAKKRDRTIVKVPKVPKFYLSARTILGAMGVDLNTCAALDGLSLLNDAALEFAVQFHKDVMNMGRER